MMSMTIHTAVATIHTNHGDIVVNLASLEDIIESKRYANSAKDREALPELDSLRRHVSDPRGSLPDPCGHEPIIE